MWVKFKKHISRSKGYEADLSPSKDSGKIVLKSFRRIPSSYASFVEGGSLSSEHPPLPRDGVDACKCGPLLSFHKQLFGSIKNKKHDCSVENCSVPNKENVGSDDDREGCGDAFNSQPVEIRNSPKSTYQSSSPNQGCLAQGCIPNLENYKYGSVQEEQHDRCSPQLHDLCREHRLIAGNKIFNNNDFNKDVEHNTEIIFSNGLVNDEDDTINMKLEQELDENFAFLDLDRVRSEHELRKSMLGESMNTQDTDQMSSSAICSGVKLSPPKMKRREKARPASAVEPRRNHQHPGNHNHIQVAKAAKKPDDACRVSRNLCSNISDILDDAVYCMEVANAVRIEVKDVGFHGQEAVEVTDSTLKEVELKPCRLPLNYEANCKTMKRNRHAYPEDNTDESDRKETGYTTLEDVQMLMQMSCMANNNTRNPPKKKKVPTATLR